MAGESVHSVLDNKLSKKLQVLKFGNCLLEHHLKWKWVGIYLALIESLLTTHSRLQAKFNYPVTQYFILYTLQAFHLSLIQQKKSPKLGFKQEPCCKATVVTFCIPITRDNKSDKSERYRMFSYSLTKILLYS